MITRQVITDNSQEIISTYYDKTRFGIIHYDKRTKAFNTKVYNPREVGVIAEEIADFIGGGSNGKH